MQDRLNRAGIRTYHDFARADPEAVMKAIGRQAEEPRINEWIAEAKERVSEGKQ